MQSLFLHLTCVIKEVAMPLSEESCRCDKVPVGFTPRECMYRSFVIWTPYLSKLFRPQRNHGKDCPKASPTLRAGTYRSSMYRHKLPKSGCFKSIFEWGWPRWFKEEVRVPKFPQYYGRLGTRDDSCWNIEGILTSCGSLIYISYLQSGGKTLPSGYSTRLSNRGPCQL